MKLTTEEAIRHLGNLPREYVEKMCDRLDKLVEVLGIDPGDASSFEEKLNAQADVLQHYDQTRLASLEEVMMDAEGIIKEFGHTGFQKIARKLLNDHREYMQLVHQENESVINKVLSDFGEILEIAEAHAETCVIIDPTLLNT